MRWFSLCWLFAVSIALGVSGTGIGFILGFMGLPVLLWHLAVMHQAQAYCDLVTCATREMRMTMLGELAQKLHDAHEDNVELQLLASRQSLMEAENTIGDPEARAKTLLEWRKENEARLKKEQKQVDRKIREAKQDFWRAAGVVHAQHEGHAMPKSYKELLPPKDAVPAYDPD
ncbi:MAG: hypothetical protein AAB463_01235 [Patescibacteria group bacterium]